LKRYALVPGLTSTLVLQQQVIL